MKNFSKVRIEWNVKNENRVREKKAKSVLLPARFRISRVEHLFDPEFLNVIIWNAFSKHFLGYLIETSCIVVLSLSLSVCVGIVIVVAVAKRDVPHFYASCLE
jgi:hypothetical protein